MSLDFNDKVVVVTGAGNGLGRSHALLFGSLGAKVVVNDLGGSGSGEGSDATVADAVVAEIKASGGDAVANPDSVIDGDKIIQCALDNFGSVDVVINNAGILRDKSFHKMSDEDWDLVYQVHLQGAFKVSRAAFPHMRDQGYGRFVMTPPPLAYTAISGRQITAQRNWPCTGSPRRLRSRDAARTSTQTPLVPSPPHA